MPKPSTPSPQLPSPLTESDIQPIAHIERKAALLLIAVASLVLAFLVYNNLVNLGQSWVYSGAITFEGLLLVLHGGVLMLGLLWLAKRNNNWTWRSALRKRVQGARYRSSP